VQHDHGVQEGEFGNVAAGPQANHTAEFVRCVPAPFKRGRLRSGRSSSPSVTFSLNVYAKSVKRRERMTEAERIEYDRAVEWASSAAPMGTSANQCRQCRSLKRLPSMKKAPLSRASA
jgi:hypothetical protein